MVHTLYSLHGFVKLRKCQGFLNLPSWVGGGDVAEAAATGRDDEAVRRFIERFALNLVEAGMPRMPARVFAALLSADDGRCTAAELAALLGVSPAAISGAVRYLVQVRMATREREPGERVDHYRVSTETWYEAITRRDELLARWVQDFQDGVKAVGPDTPAGARLEETRQFFEFLMDEIPKVMARWRARRPR
jgi:DNA-binding transcriptional regulator GbsR (MarR family)